MTSSTPFALAQTPGQLYRQLIELGYDDADLIRVRRAHDLVLELFSAHVRASGKSFEAHLVGSASALATFGSPPDEVVAGLLHAVYPEGDWGNLRRRVTPAKRRRVVEIGGDAVEAMVSAYNDFPWGPDEISAMAAAPERLSPFDRRIVVLRLANELDDAMGEDVLYAAPDRRAHKTERLRRCVALAEAIERPDLADAVRRAHEHLERIEVPDALLGDRHVSSLRPPRTLMMRPHLRAAAFLRGQRRRLLGRP